MGVIFLCEENVFKSILKMVLNSDCTKSLTCIHPLNGSAVGHFNSISLKLILKSHFAQRNTPAGGPLPTGRELWVPQGKLCP